MSAAGKPVSICLKSMTQSRLHNPFTLFNLANQSMDIGNEVFINASRIRSNDGTQQDST
jgi:hypothetical protein